MRDLSEFLSPHVRARSAGARDFGIVVTERRPRVHVTSRPEVVQILFGQGVDGKGKTVGDRNGVKDRFYVFVEGVVPDVDHDDAKVIHTERTQVQRRTQRPRHVKESLKLARANIPHRPGPDALWAHQTPRRKTPR